MLIYFITLFVVLIAAFAAMQSRSVAVSRIFIGIIFISLLLPAGLRDRTVGTDSGYYVKDFEATRTFAQVLTHGNVIGGEYGFWILNWMVHFVSDEYRELFFAIAMISIGCYLYAIVDQSSNIVISIFVFFAMGFYVEFFNAARQGIACAICALAFGPMRERKLLKFLGIVILASSFHNSALITLPIYFISQGPNTVKKNVLIIAAASAMILIVVNVTSLFPMVSERYSAYGISGQGGGYIVVAFSSSLAILFLALKKMIVIARDRYDYFLNIFLFGITMGVVSTLLNLDPSGILRFRMYFTVAVVFLWPIVFQNINDRLTKFVVGYIFIFVMFLYLTVMLQSFSNLVPYTFNPNLGL